MMVLIIKLEILYPLQVHLTLPEIKIIMPGFWWFIELPGLLWSWLLGLGFGFLGSGVEVIQQVLVLLCFRRFGNQLWIVLVFSCVGYYWFQLIEGFFNPDL